MLFLERDIAFGFFLNVILQRFFAQAKTVMAQLNMTVLLSLLFLYSKGALWSFSCKHAKFMSEHCLYPTC